ncbi:methyltransferase [Streptomyces sp. NPDC057654]|uniref:methyltransferase n=1 Tax=Streptomyces sp. NPDC057654 TaxID=3346196 RepID=UPI0036C558AB
MQYPRTERDHAASPDRILEVGLGFQAAKVLLSAVRLDLFTVLAERPMPYEELRARLDLHPRSARDFLDALVALGMLHRTGGDLADGVPDGLDGPDDPEGPGGDCGTYANTPSTARYLDRGRSTYIGGFLEMADNRLYDFWGGLAEALRTGEPQNEVKKSRDGGDLFDSLYEEPARLTEFQQAMTGLSARSAHALAEAFDWSGHRTVADIGCAEGALLTHLLRERPHLEGIGFDLPAVAGNFHGLLERSGLADRLSFTGGDFLTGPLPTADVLILGHVLHDWDLPTKRMLLRKAYEALPEGGAVIVCEALIDDDRRENATGLLTSLNMLIETTGGFDFTGADCRRWLAGAGFGDNWVRRLTGTQSMAVGVK